MSEATITVGTRVRVKDDAKEGRHRGKTGEMIQAPMGRAGLAVVLSEEETDGRGFAPAFLVHGDDLEPVGDDDG